MATQIGEKVAQMMAKLAAKGRVKIKAQITAITAMTVMAKIATNRRVEKTVEVTLLGMAKKKNGYDSPALEGTRKKDILH